MDCISTRLPYRQTGAFSKIALDYIDQDARLKPFIANMPTISGIENAIGQRKKINTDRDLLVRVLKKQYEKHQPHEAVARNIDALSSPNCFTITTAHQNNLFTGPLYFLYKILHVIRLSEYLTTALPSYKFIPVFYLGTEDADLEELNHIYLDKEKLEWKTTQTGAVGRMKIDKELVGIVEKMEGQLLVQPYGKELVKLLKDCYRPGTDIQTATFDFVNALFGEWGLLILLPDNGLLKRKMVGIFRDDLQNQTASGIVEATAARLTDAGYKVQANPREINLFYLLGDKRERIVEKNGTYYVLNTRLSFSPDQLLQELDQYPDRFSPNVILRGLYQETILPNLVFVGGGGETAYWLQLKDLFDHYHVPYPVLVLRNSFLLVEKKWLEKLGKLGFTPEDFFLPERELVNRLVLKESKNETRLNGAMPKLEQLYEAFKKQAAAVDASLVKHVDALKLKSVHRLQELEKKMLRAEKRKFADQQRQIHTIYEHLFPGNGLQERHENISYYYAKWGPGFLKQLYRHSLGLEQEFVILSEEK